MGKNEKETIFPKNDSQTLKDPTLKENIRVHSNIRLLLKTFWSADQHREAIRVFL